MAQVSIIGTGNMAQGLKALFERGNNDVTLIAKDELTEASFAEIVVIAVPYSALTSIAATVGNKFDCKVVVDITNPVDFATLSPISVTAGSAAQELQDLLPAAKVVKAFNTTFAATLASGHVGDSDVVALLASDHSDAKEALTAAIEADSHAHALDAGALVRAKELEAMGFVQISLGATEQIPWTGGFAIQC